MGCRGGDSSLGSNHSIGEDAVGIIWGLEATQAAFSDCLGGEAIQWPCFSAELGSRFSAIWGSCFNDTRRVCLGEALRDEWYTTGWNSSSI